MFEFDKARGKSVLATFKHQQVKMDTPVKQEDLMQRVRYTWNDNKFLKEAKPYIIDPPTTTGIEVEVEGVDDGQPFVSMLWNTTPDGSLKDQGIEVVSSVLPPCAVGHFLKEMEVWMKYNPLAKFTHRCSVHVHLGVQNLTVEQLVTLITTYLTVEDVLFRSMFPHRLHNSYCFPMNQTGFTLEDFERSALDPKMFKYCALNVYHLRDFGTVEFRHHPGCLDVSNWVQWLNVIYCLYKFSQKTSLAELVNTLKHLNMTSEYDVYIRSIFNEYVPDYPELHRRTMRNAVLSAKHFLGEEF